MKKNELRIGNLVNDSMYVVCINWSDIYLNKEIEPLLMIGGYYKRYKIEDITPILLTKEWLIKCGLILHDLTTKEYVDKNEVGIYLGKDDLYYVISSEEDNCGNIYYVDKHIKYLHQLQNLYFALTCIELEFTNDIKK